MRPPAEYPERSTRSRRLRAVGVALSLLVTAAAIGMVVVLWTGAGAHYESFAHAERLPWPHEGFDPLPGVAATFDIESRRDVQPRVVWGTRWSAMRWQMILLGLLSCAFATYMLERKRRRRIEPLALLAASLALAMAYRMLLALDAYMLDGVMETPPLTHWRLAQAGSSGVVILQVATAVVAAIALIRIAYCRDRYGLSLALFSLFTAPYAFFCVDILFLAPYHMDATFAATDVRLPRAVNADFDHWRGMESEWRIVLREDGQASTEFSSIYATARSAQIEYAGEWSDVGFLDALDEIVEHFPEGFWIPGGRYGRRLDIPVRLEIDEAVPFEWVRSVLDRLGEHHATYLQILTAPPIANAPPFLLDTWVVVAESDEPQSEEPVIELVPSVRAYAPAEALFAGVRYEHAGAASAAHRSRFDSDERFRLRVQDGVPWRDVVHALDAFWFSTGLDLRL